MLTASNKQLSKIALSVVDLSLVGLPFWSHLPGLSNITKQVNSKKQLCQSFQKDVLRLSISKGLPNKAGSLTIFQDKTEP